MGWSKRASSSHHHSHSHRRPRTPPIAIPRRRQADPSHKQASSHLPAPAAAAAASSSSRHAQARPQALPRRADSYHTRYVNMLLSLDTIPRLHNIFAALFSWLLLAGWVVFPGTFTSIERSLDDNEAVQSSDAAGALLRTVRNIPLLVVAAVCCGVGTAGLLWLFWRWRRNYVWLLNRLFLPGVLNGLAGLIASLVSVYAQQDGDWSITAKVTAIAEGAVVAVCGVLFVVYNSWLLEGVKRRHGRDLARWDAEDGGEGARGKREGEGLVEKVERKAREPPLEPGSVV